MSSQGWAWNDLDMYFWDKWNLPFIRICFFDLQDTLVVSPQSCQYDASQVTSSYHLFGNCLNQPLPKFTNIWGNYINLKRPKQPSNVMLSASWNLVTSTSWCNMYSSQYLIRLLKFWPVQWFNINITLSTKTMLAKLYCVIGKSLRCCNLCWRVCKVHCM